MSTHASPVREAGPPPSTAWPAPKSRLLYIDNLRIVLISMVVLLHLAITYGAMGDWSYNENVPESIPSAVHIFHPLVIVSLAYALSGMYMIGAAKWVLVVPLALALCFLVAHYMRKLPVVRDLP